jgi:5-(carboxyamino)imidazole ribonucleotide mutase
MQAKVIIVMGSVSDMPVMQKAAQVLSDFAAPFEMYILSAHRTPEESAKLAQQAAGRGIEVIIAAAGMAAHLAGMMAAHTTLPVIGVPLAASLEGMDALLSTTQMPQGVPVAAVGIGNAANAALLAVQILATHDSRLQQALVEFKETLKQKVLAAASEIAKLDMPYMVKNEDYH